MLEAVDTDDQEGEGRSRAAQAAAAWTRSWKARWFRQPVSPSRSARTAISAA
ncbi:MAG: hypothetical protein M3Q27_16320 [Actinomycetota bacterium]|nr:hypothetical protein [Actinomycetota bacterium]